VSTSIQQLAIEGVYNDLLTLVPGTIGGTFNGVTLQDSDVYKLRVVSLRKPAPLTRYPAIVCGAPLDESEVHDGPQGTNITEEIGYPVLVAIAAPIVGSEAETLALNDDSDLFFNWRDIILRRYHNQLPSAVSAAVSTAKECKAQPRAIFDSTQWNDAGLMASAVMVYVMCDRERS
jgi:hypothetical protein